MLKSGDVLDLGPLRTKFHIRKTAAETDGQTFEVEMEMGPRTGGTPVHTHPQAVETFEVLQGQFDVYVQDAWRTLVEGEKVSVEKGVPHTLRNSSDEVTRAIMAFQPAMQYDRYFERLHKLLNNGAIESEKMNLKAMLYLSRLMTSYPDEIRSVKPPYAAMRAMASLGGLLGYQV